MTGHSRFATVTPAGPELPFAVPVAGAQHLDDGARRGVGVLDDADHLVPGRVEGDAGLRVPRVAEQFEDVHRLVADRPDALHDRTRIGVGMGQGELEVVQDRQEGGRRAGTLDRPLRSSSLAWRLRRLSRSASARRQRSSSSWIAVVYSSSAGVG